MSEHCQWCRQLVTSTKGRADDHPSLLFMPGPCLGTGKPTAERRANRKDARTAAKRREIHKSRSEAAVMLDAVLVGRSEMDDRLQPLLKLALAEYRLDHPTSRVQDIWRNVERMQPGRWVRSGRVDVFCTFCGLLLGQNWVRGWSNVQTSANELTARVDTHCVPCALQHLAGMRVAVAPDVRVLPRDDEVRS